MALCGLRIVASHLYGNKIFLTFIKIIKNFDNMDGKQARKTGNSSPLGLLFDHGCDSLILMLQGLSLATVLQIGNNWQSLMVYLIGCMPFFFTTLEEYYTNAMILPVINGPCEGCLVIGMFFLITGINGNIFLYFEYFFFDLLVFHSFFKKLIFFRMQLLE